MRSVKHPCGGKILALCQEALDGAEEEPRG